MSAKRDTPGSRSFTRRTLKACEENSPQPFRLRRVTRTNQGLRSFHSLTPGYLPCTPPACKTAGGPARA